MAMVPENQYWAPTNTKANRAPMVSPPVPPTSSPISMNRPPKTVRIRIVLKVFLLISNSSLTPKKVPPPANVPAHGSVVVPGVDVDAGHPLRPEHLEVSAVVLEGQPELESVAAELVDRFPLEVPGRRVVAVIAHDQQVPAEVVAVQPGERLRLDAQRP